MKAVKVSVYKVSVYLVPNDPAGRTGDAVILDPNSPTRAWCAEWMPEADDAWPLTEEDGDYIPAPSCAIRSVILRQITKLEIERGRLFDEQKNTPIDAPRRDGHLWIDSQPGDEVYQIRHAVPDPGSGWPAKTYERGITALGKRYVVRDGQVVGFLKKNLAEIESREL